MTLGIVAMSLIYKTVQRMVASHVKRLTTCDSDQS